MQSVDIEEFLTETPFDNDELIELTNCCGSNDPDNQHKDTSEINTLIADLIEKAFSQS